MDNLRPSPQSVVFFKTAIILVIPVINRFFFKGVSPWFLSKESKFCLVFFLGRSRQKRFCFDILGRKECFKTVQKIEMFQRG